MRVNSLLRVSRCCLLKPTIATRNYSPTPQALDALLGNTHKAFVLKYDRSNSIAFARPDWEPNFLQYGAIRPFGGKTSSPSKKTPKHILITEALSNHLNEIKKNFASLEATVLGSGGETGEDDASPAVQMRKRKATREYAKLQPFVSAYDEYLALLEEFEGLESVEDGAKGPGADDKELLEMIAEERRVLEDKLRDLKQSLLSSLLPEDPENERGVILEVRAAAGGDEATLFASELLDMYRLYAGSRGWEWTPLELSASEVGGVKLASAVVSGSGAYGSLRYECGVHRVQRVPRTETQGRLHTSTASVAVLPEAEDVDVSIRPEDVRVETMRASGAGGQHVNVTDSAVRLTHGPTGISISCQQERSQQKNMTMAWKLLRSKIYDLEQQKAKQKVSDRRQAAIGSGDRNERIRTYNAPQDRMTDHRVGFTCNNLEEVMEGQVIDKLAKMVLEKEQNEQLQAMGALD